MTRGGIEPVVEPKEVGLDAVRLDRIAAHFDRYVAEGRLAGWQCAVSRGDKVAWTRSGGLRDHARNLPVEPDTLWRIYSMTKPVTSIAAMMLYEEARFDLNDEVARWLPSFAEPRVYVAGAPEAPETRPATSPILIWHLLTHMAGLTYGFQRLHPVDAIYRLGGYDFGQPRGVDLAAGTEAISQFPLVADPGSAWNYSVATDVVGRLVELWSGLAFDEFLRRRIFEPLGMDDTGFWCAPDHLDRLAELYVFSPPSGIRQGGALARLGTKPASFLSGGGGLVSSARDYQRFASMLLHGGELGGVRLVSPATLELMSRNHLPGGADLETAAIDSFAESSMAGIGFGLGFSRVIDPARLKLGVSEGTISWGGAASTTFWVDRAAGVTCQFFTQLIPSSTYPIRRELQQLVYGSLTD